MKSIASHSKNTFIFFVSYMQKNCLNGLGDRLIKITENFKVVKNYFLNFQ